MAGVSTGLAAYDYKQAFYTIATEYFKEPNPEFEVIRGLLGAKIPEQYMQVLGTTSELDAATMSSNRTREMVVRLETQWFVFRYGEVDADREAEDILFTRLRDLEQHIRVNDITLGGVVRECFVSSVATDSASVEEAGTSQGRLAAAIVIWEAKIRISNQ